MTIWTCRVCGEYRHHATDCSESRIDELEREVEALKAARDSQMAELSAVHRAAIIAELEACAELADEVERVSPGHGAEVARRIRARGGK